MEHQQESNALDEQVVIQHETFQLHETQSRQGLEFQSHVSTRPLQVERVDSVPPVLSWLQVVLAVARPCHRAPKWIQVWHSIFPGIPRNIWLCRRINKCALRQASNQVLQVHGFCVIHTTQYLSASEKFTHVLYSTSKPDKLLPNSNCHGEYRRFREDQCEQLYLPLGARRATRGNASFMVSSGLPIILVFHNDLGHCRVAHFGLQDVGGIPKSAFWLCSDHVRLTAVFDLFSHRPQHA